jgi:hypothetical protein
VDEDTTFEELEALDQHIDAADKRVDTLLDAREFADNRAPELRYVRGIGRFVIPYSHNWQDLNALIADKSLNIDFSVYDYPSFDGVVQQFYNKEDMVNPLSAGYENLENLRHNIAAVRNYLIMHYFSHEPDPKTFRIAEQSLRDMAKHLGRGLKNNQEFLGLIPYNDPTKPYIDLELASLPNGEGATYIYERLLAVQRQNNWLHPFTAVSALFSGVQSSEWGIPEIEHTPFGTGDFSDPELEGPSDAFIEDAIEEAEDLRTQRNAKRQALREKSLLQRMAIDLDALGNQLLFGAQNGGGVAGLSEPVRHDAIEIAKDILKKLKIKFGDVNILDGLNLKPKDDIAVIGGVQGVAMVYERLLAYARTVDMGILGHPAVHSATQALGQMGYLAKLEAMKLANQAGSTKLADNIAMQMQSVPKQFSRATNARLGGLIERVEKGIDTVLDRIQAITGPQAMVGNSIEHNIDSGMNDTPLAGMELRVQAGAKSKDKNSKAFQLTEAIENSQRAQAQRIQQSLAGDAARRSGVNTSINRNATGKQALMQARENARQLSSKTNASRQNPGAYIPTYIISGANRTRDKTLYYHKQNSVNQGYSNPAQAVVAKLDPRIIQNLRNSTKADNLLTEAIGPRSGSARHTEAPLANQKKDAAVSKTHGTQETSQPTSSPQYRDELLRPDPSPRTPSKGGRGF